MAVAVHLKTESGDDYLYVFDGQPSHQEVNKKLKEELGDEIDYVCSYEYESTFKQKTKFKLERSEAYEEE